MADLEPTDEALVDSSLTAKAAWNAFADEYSQWKVLSIEEQIHWVEAFAAAREEGRREGIEEAAKVMENLCFFTDIDEQLAMTKQDMSVRTCHEGAKAIRDLAEKQP